MCPTNFMKGRNPKIAQKVSKFLLNKKVRILECKYDMFWLSRRNCLIIQNFGDHTPLYFCWATKKVDCDIVCLTIYTVF